MIYQTPSQIERQKKTYIYTYIYICILDREILLELIHVALLSILFNVIMLDINTAHQIRTKISRVKFIAIM